MSSGATDEGRAARVSLAARSNANPPVVEAGGCADENGDRNGTSGAAKDEPARADATPTDCPGILDEERNALAPNAPDPESRVVSTPAADGNPMPRSRRATGGR